MSKKKLSRIDLKKMKDSGQMVVWITAYDYWTASFAEQADMDMILVGDSLGMCVYGYEGTVPVTMDQCIYHSEGVRRGAPNTFVIGDMPFLSYQVNIEEAVRNADGQLMICSDVLGIFQAFTPKFVKKYENLADKTINAFSKYVEEARNGKFPEDKHTYKMVEGELPKPLEILKRK